jgi:hypothetical protein
MWPARAPATTCGGACAPRIFHCRLRPTARDVVARQFLPVNPPFRIRTNGSLRFLTAHLTGPTSKKPFVYAGPNGLTAPDPWRRVGRGTRASRPGLGMAEGLMRQSFRVGRRSCGASTAQDGSAGASPYRRWRIRPAKWAGRHRRVACATQRWRAQRPWMGRMERSGTR